jgi:site-specific recombinase XerD
MPTKKVKTNGTEIAVFEDAVIYKRGEYWHFRMWLAKERKYVRLSLNTTNLNTAKEELKKHYYELKAKEYAGVPHFSKTAKDGVAMYLEQRQKHIGVNITKGRYSTIKTHLEHWLNYIKRDTKLKELGVNACEDYYSARQNGMGKKKSISQTTIENEQATINAMMKWLYKHQQANIDGFEFIKLKRADRGDESLRRNSFTDDEIVAIRTELEKYITDAQQNINEKGNLVKAIAGYYLMVSLMFGLRRGEQIQLEWRDYEEFRHRAGKEKFNLVKLTIRAETSKVNRTRRIVEKDIGFFADLFNLQYPNITKFQKTKVKEEQKKFGNTIIFSVNGDTAISNRAIAYHFDKVMKLAEVDNLKKRNIVPYSFRHYYITSKVNSGLAPTSVSEIAGTSTTQIENTYYHTTEAKLITNAFAGYTLKDGLLIPTLL